MSRLIDKLSNRIRGFFIFISLSMFGIANFRDSEVFGTQGVRYEIPKAEFRTQKFGIPFFGIPCFRDSGGIPFHHECEICTRWVNCQNHNDYKTAIFNLIKFQRLNIIYVPDCWMSLTYGYIAGYNNYIKICQHRTPYHTKALRS